MYVQILVILGNYKSVIECQFVWELVLKHLSLVLISRKNRRYWLKRGGGTLDFEVSRHLSGECGITQQLHIRGG